MQIKYIIFFMVSFASLAGCGLYGPRYSKPDVKALTNWSSKDLLGDVTTISINMPLIAWWEKFGDTQLNSLILVALKNNNNIQVAEGNIKVAQGYLKQVEFAWVPVIGLGTVYSSSAQYMMPSGYSVGFMPNYSLNIFQQLRTLDYAKANVKLVIATKNAVRLTVISQTVAGYFTLLGQDYQLKLQNELVNDRSQLLSLARIEYKKGLISLYQLQQYEQNYEIAKAQIFIIKNNIVSSQNALRVLLNQNPGEIKRGLSFLQLDSAGKIPINLPSQILEQRPDIKQAEAQLMAANANVGIATSIFFPSISLTGSDGLMSSQLTNLFTTSTNFWNQQIALSMPFLSLSTYGQIDAAKGGLYAAYYNYIQVVRSAFAEIDTGLSRHDEYTKSLVAQVKNYISAKLAYQLANKGFKQGLYSLPTLLNNKITLDNATINVATIKLAQLNAIVLLYQSLAGGYSYADYIAKDEVIEKHK